MKRNSENWHSNRLFLCRLSSDPHWGGEGGLSDQTVWNVLKVILCRSQTEQTDVAHALLLLCEMSASESWRSDRFQVSCCSTAKLSFSEVERCVLFFFIWLVIARRVFCSVWLTDGGDEVQKPLLGEQRVLQASEVQLQHSGHRVYVVVILVVNQRVFTCTKRE